MSHRPRDIRQAPAAPISTRPDLAILDGHGPDGLVALALMVLIVAAAALVPDLSTYVEIAVRVLFAAR